MADIFVSYSRQDKERAAQFVQLLEDCGWDVFWDQETRAGTLWPKVLEDELGLARCLLVLWTANSVLSRWVRIEAYEALQGDKLLPVRLENVKPPMEFRQTQTFDLVGWTGERDDPRLDHLIADLCILAKLTPRKGRAGPATLNAVRTLAPTTLGASNWEVPDTVAGAPDFSGRHAQPYSAVELTAPTLAPHEQEPLQRAAMSVAAETLPSAQPPVLTSPATQSSAKSSDAQESNDEALQSTSANDLSPTTTVGPLGRRMWWGAGVAVMAIAGVWIASSLVGPREVSLKDDFKPELITEVPAPSPPSAAVAAPITTTVPAGPPAASMKTTPPKTRPSASSNRCIEITERFQQTGRLTAEERQFLSSKECAR